MPKLLISSSDIMAIENCAQSTATHRIRFLKNKYNLKSSIRRIPIKYYSQWSGLTIEEIQKALS